MSITPNSNDKMQIVRRRDWDTNSGPPICMCEFQ